LRTWLTEKDRERSGTRREKGKEKGKKRKRSRTRHALESLLLGDEPVGILEHSDHDLGGVLIVLQVSRRLHPIYYKKKNDNEYDTLRSESSLKRRKKNPKDRCRVRSSSRWY